MISMNRQVIVTPVGPEVDRVLGPARHVPANVIYLLRELPGGAISPVLDRFFNKCKSIFQVSLGCNLVTVDMDPESVESVVQVICGILVKEKNATSISVHVPGFGSVAVMVSILACELFPGRGSGVSLITRAANPRLPPLGGMVVVRETSRVDLGCRVPRLHSTLARSSLIPVGLGPATHPAPSVTMPTPTVSMTPRPAQ
jgi:hypothetical protein